MKDSLLLIKYMGGEKWFGQVEKNMKENEEIILVMVWELENVIMVKYIKGSILIIKEKGKVFIYMLVEPGSLMISKLNFK